MYNSKKGGIAIEELVGMLTAMFTFVIISIFIFYFFNVIDHSKKQKQVEVSFSDLDVTYNLNLFLSLRLEENKSVADLINEAYITNNYEQLKTVSDKFFLDIYSSQNLDYDITIDVKSINPISLGKVTKSVVKMPTMDKKVINVGLFIGERMYTSPHYD